MKTLILCVDRDDDFGVKAGITSPIIGRKDNLRAAISLGLKDPEDSDTNSLFAAIQLYDQQRELGQDTEIATLCGNKSVGTKSDRIISIQLETVIELTKPDHVIMVSDGAEDEFILPIISSRIKIDSIKRVIIRQQKNIEGTLYFITKAIQDEKVSKNILIPIALVFLIWGIFSLFNMAYYAIGATLIALGLYIMIKALHLEEPALRIGRDITEALRTERYILAASIIFSIFIICGGIFQGWTASNKEAEPFPFNILIFLEYSIIFYIAAALLYTLGQTLDNYLRTGAIIHSSFSIILGIFAIWFIFLAVNHILQYFFNLIDHFNFLIVLLNIAIGGFFGFFAIESYFYVKEHFSKGSATAQY